MRNKQYHEVDVIERKATRLALQSTTRLQSLLVAQYNEIKHGNHLQQVNIIEPLVKDLLQPSVAAAIIAHLRGAKRSFLFADESFALPDLALAYEDEHREFKKPLHPDRNKKHNVVKRVTRLPVKKLVKQSIRDSINITVEGIEETAPQEIVDAIVKAKKVRKEYKKGKKLYREIKKMPIRKVGEKAQIKSVPSPHPKKAYLKSRGKFKQKVDQETARVRSEIKEKIKKEKKYLYDELVRHLRTIIKDVAVLGIRVTNWQEVLNRLTNQERSVQDIESLIKYDRFNDKGKLVEKGIESRTQRLIEKLVNKAYRKIRDKRDRAKAEIKAKGIKEFDKAVVKPIKETVKSKIEYKIFGEPRKAGSHRQYRGMHYYVAKSLQELERGQKRRRQYEKAQRIYGALGSIADLVGFFEEYNVQDTFAFMAELGGATFFPETYKIGGIIKAANFVGGVAHTLNIDFINDFTDEDSKLTRVKRYQVDRALNLIQELITLKKLFTIYHPRVYKLLDTASTKVNDNLRTTVNNLILSGANVNEAKVVLAEAFRANGIAPRNPYQIETIYRTQAQLAFSAGRFQTDQHPAIQEILWGYKYITVGDTRVRKAHRIFDGVTLPKNHEFWLYFWPPNSWNCRCSVISIFEERKIVLPPQEWQEVWEKEDKSFSFNPGLVFTEAYAKFV